jgi:hypothetical protein
MLSLHNEALFKTAYGMVANGYPWPKTLSGH